VALSDRIPYQAQIDRPKLTLPAAVQGVDRSQHAGDVGAQCQCLQRLPAVTTTWHWWQPARLATGIARRSQRI